MVSSKRPLLIPLTLEGHAGSRPQGYAKVAIAGELENAFHKRFTVTGRNRKAATVLLEHASDLTMFGADKDRRATGGGDAVEFARHDQTLQFGVKADWRDSTDHAAPPIGAYNKGSYNSRF